MKEWFKYKYGFVNVDAENLYFTNTGNWSEIEGLEEKGIQKQNTFRQFRMKFIPFILIVIAVFLFIFQFEHTKIKFSLIFGILVLAFTAYKYLKREIGEKFTLPISKIENIILRGETATVTFRDGEGKSTEQLVENLDQKGISLLEELIEKTL
ncbi:hypothetical protein [Kordia sp.]|uniref:hypothetical protein n=1 Tax=Kordia sp. TaxID=1965332 RepID=UPI003B5C8B5A